jgi:hypothetical protein
MKYGARYLKPAIGRHIVFPLADLVATRQVSWVTSSGSTAIVVAE